jgi:mRNA interferase RelE/StbE
MYSVEFTKEAAKQLQAKERLFRLRSGAYRIVYQVDGRRLLILVLKIGNRKEIYRKKD